jgi:type IV pilus assembly protein PilV
MNERRTQSGLSLVEVLIATVILALGLLGIAGLQMSGVQSNYYAYQATQASVLAQNLAERMRTNRIGVLDGRYALSVGSAPSAPDKNCAAEGETCSSAELAAWDMAIWYSMLATGTSYTDIPAGATALLPGGQASVTCLDASCIAQSVRLITVYWDADRNGATGTTCGSARTDLKCFRLAFVP